MQDLTLPFSDEIDRGLLAQDRGAAEELKEQCRVSHTYANATC